MTTSSTFIIVGGGLAGAKAAEALRDNDFDGHIVLFAAEEHLPYERPPLSKEYLAGKKTLDDFTVDASAWYRDHHVELQLGTEVASIDPGAHTVSLPDGSNVGYDKLLLATGSEPRRPPIPGADANGVHYLRTIDDAATLNSVLAEGSSLAIVGAGWIGLEVAAGARERGVDVTVVEMAELPLLAALGREAAEVFAALHRDHGVDLRLGATVDEITTSGGNATGLKLGDGSTVSADAVLVAVGAAPNTGLAEAGRAGDGRWRCAGRLVAAHQRSGHLRRRGHRRRRTSAVRCAHPHRALGQRAQAAGRRGGRDARQASRIRRTAILLHRSVRPRDGIRRARTELRAGGVPRRRRRPRVRGVLARRRQPGAGGDERQHLGRARRRQVVDPHPAPRSTRTGWPTRSRRWAPC